MKYLFLILLLILASATGQAQDFTELLPEKPPKTAKQNAMNLFAGVALQTVGICVTAASVYFTLEANEEDLETGFSGIGFGLGLTATGTVLMIASLHNIVEVRKSYHDKKKELKKKGISINIEPTNYGVGLVCRF